MLVYYTKAFEKQFSRIETKTQQRFKSRLRLFLQDQTHAMLRVHALQGKYKGYWSMNVTGDVRALYREDGDTIVIFAFIGTHNQLYRK